MSKSDMERVRSFCVVTAASVVTLDLTDLIQVIPLLVNEVEIGEYEELHFIVMMVSVIVNWMVLVIMSHTVVVSTRHIPLIATLLIITSFATQIVLLTLHITFLPLLKMVGLLLLMIRGKSII